MQHPSHERTRATALAAGHDFPVQLRCNYLQDTHTHTHSLLRCRVLHARITIRTCAYFVLWVYIDPQTPKRLLQIDQPANEKQAVLHSSFTIHSVTHVYRSRPKNKKGTLP